MPSLRQRCETSADALAKQYQYGSYNITAVTMFKSERRRLREWTHHYIFEGVDHFLLVFLGLIGRLVVV